MNKWGDENSRTKITPIRKTLYLFSRFLRTQEVNSIDIKYIGPIFGQKLRLISVLYFQFTSRANFRADFCAQIYVNWFDPQGLVQNMSEQACMKQSTVSFTHSLAIVLHWGTVIQWPFSTRNRLIHLLSRVQTSRKIRGPSSIGCRRGRRRRDVRFTELRRMVHELWGIHIWRPHWRGAGGVSPKEDLLREVAWI